MHMARPRLNILGPALFFVAVTSLTATSTAQHRVADTQRLLVYGKVKNQHLGESLLGCEDRNGDGVGDLIVLSRVRFNSLLPPFLELHSGRTGAVIPGFRFAPKSGDIRRIHPAGDLNGDGFAEFAVRRLQPEELRLLDGKTWKTIFVWPLLIGNDWGCAPFPDVNRDGHPELLLSATGLATSIGGKSRRGRVQLLSGKDLSLLQEQWGDTTGTFGESIGAVGDVNGDGQMDYGVQDQDSGGTRSGSLLIYSGRSGKLIAEFKAGRLGSRDFASRFVSPGDINGDGHADIAVRDPSVKYNSTQLGVVRMLSGKDASILWEFKSNPYNYSGHGCGLALVADWNGDGRDDLIGSFDGRLAVLSSKDGKLIYEWPGIVGPTEAFSFDSLGDIDGDKRGDYALGLSYRSDFPLIHQGCVLVLGSKKPSLLASKNDLRPVSSRGVELSMDFGQGMAGTPYLLLGSASGIRPGLRIGGQLIPLQLDAYMQLILAAPGSLIAKQVGILDASGRAKAKFVVPPSLVKTFGEWHFDHAAIVLDPQKGLRAVSNPAPLHVWPKS
ncbi:MAG: hypothetical protein CSA62_00620 [Planctomycetota bacterium]|nr:MAG: hypothetical protein CSA62_00620 [Planctomycetota bacterium]